MTESTSDFDISYVFRTILEQWQRIAVATIAGTLISLGYAFLAPIEYDSSVQLVPTETQSVSQLGTAAALLGKGAAPGLEDIDLYQTLLTSRKVLMQLSNTKFKVHEEQTEQLPLWEIYEVDSSSRIEMFYFHKALEKKVLVNTLGLGVGGVIQVSVRAKSPLLAQNMANAIVLLGQNEIESVRRMRFEAVISKLANAANSAKREWDTSVSKLTEYREINRSSLLPFQQLDLARLEMERQVREQKYLLARREEEQQKLEREKAAPPAVILDAAFLPVKKSHPKRQLIVVLGFILSASISGSAVILWSIFGKIGHLRRVID